MYQIAIIDDHRVLLDGLKGVVKEDESIHSVDTYWKVKDFFHAIKNGCTYDLLITDIQMPDLSGVELIHELKKRKEDMRVMVMSMLDTPELVQSLLKLGISGYFLKGNGAEELRKGIGAVLKDETWFSPEIRPVVQQFMDGNSRPLLSPRELEIAVMISKGKTAKEISTDLHVSIFTVQTHRKNIFRKLKVHNTAELVHSLTGLGLG